MSYLIRKKTTIYLKGSRSSCSSKRKVAKIIRLEISFCDITVCPLVDNKLIYEFLDIILICWIYVRIMQLYVSVQKLKKL